MDLSVELGKEEDGRWIAEIPAMPGVLAYGATRDLAWQAIRALALRVIADSVERGECNPLTLTFNLYGE